MTELQLPASKDVNFAAAKEDDNTTKHRISVASTAIPATPFSHRLSETAGFPEFTFSSTVASCTWDEQDSDEEDKLPACPPFAVRSEVCASKVDGCRPDDAPSTPRTPTKKHANRWESPPPQPRCETPRTPTKKHANRWESPPPQPRCKPLPPLLKAMRKNSVEEVRRTLEEDPDAPVFPFYDHEIEPPLCSAARLGVDPQILSLLIDHGADPTMENIYGHTPIDVLRSKAYAWPSWEGFDGDLAALPPELASFARETFEQRDRQMVETAKMLVGAAAEPLSSYASF